MYQNCRKRERETEKSTHTFIQAAPQPSLTQSVLHNVEFSPVMRSKQNDYALVALLIAYRFYKSNSSIILFSISLYLSLFPSLAQPSVPS